MMASKITFESLDAYYALFALILSVVVPLVLSLNKNLIVSMYTKTRGRSKTITNTPEEYKIIGYVLYADQFMYSMANFILFALIVPVLIFFVSDGGLKKELIKLVWELNIGFLICI